MDTPPTGTAAPAQPHEHHRDGETDTRRHRRAEDTPSNGFKITPKGIGVTIPWGKLGGLVVTVGSLVGPALGLGLLSSHQATRNEVATEESKIETKQDLILEVVKKLDGKVDAIDEHQRATDIELAKIQGKMEKEQKR